MCALCVCVYLCVRVRLRRMDQADAVICTYLDHLEERTKPRGEDAPQVETLVHTSDSLAQQLMDCVSHDRALEDVLYEVFFFGTAFGTTVDGLRIT
jgi:hypothetical protein